MDYWAEALQDDSYVIAATGWVAGAKPREIVKRKNKDGKLAWPEPGDYVIGRRRFTSDLIPARLMVARFFAAEQAEIDAFDVRIAEVTTVPPELAPVRFMSLLAKGPTIEVASCGRKVSLSFHALTGFAPKLRGREVWRILALRDGFRASWRRGRCSAPTA